MQRFGGITRTGELLKRHSRCDQAPITGYVRAASVTNDQIVVHVPDCRLMRGRIVQHVIGSALAIEVGCTHQLIPSWNHWSMSAGNMGGSIHIPDHSLTRARV